MERVTDFVEATASFEQWLGERITLVGDDLREKHRVMASGLFPFLRATFYRWAQLWPVRCPDLALAPRVLAVGDLHLENFGTWRDREGRLCWGVNDFDEACPLAYTNDLVRLAASLLAAVSEGDRDVRVRPACAAIVGGYQQWLMRGGQPYVLVGKPRWLWLLTRKLVRRGPGFWKKLMAAPLCHGIPFPEARKLLEDRLPERGLTYEVRQRRAGVGSLGRPRYVALAQWRGGTVAREVKAWVPSAVTWADAAAAPDEGAINRLLAASVRSHDENLQARSGWIARRLAPDCIKIELNVLPRKNLLDLLGAMGRELANIHLATPEVTPALLDDLQRRGAHDPDWLLTAAQNMAELLRTDWKAWKKAHPGGKAAAR
jgi:hypothetical protein